jgi:spermidine synthase
MLTYSQPDENWSLYEIDPDVIRLAQDPRYFTYMRDCTAGEYSLELGDARLRLLSATDSHFGILYIDAFSSDVIPMHLLTVEALRLYRQKLVSDGILAFHLSSRHFNLEPLLANLGQALGLHCFSSTRGDITEAARAEGGFDSTWSILVPESRLPNVLAQATWTRVPPSSEAPLWTDDFSSLIGILHF